MENGIQRSLGQVEGALAALKDSVDALREHNAEAFAAINSRLDIQNGRIREGEQWRAKIVGICIGVSAVLGLAGGAIFKLVTS